MMKARLHLALFAAAMLAVSPAALSQAPARTTPAAPAKVADSNLEAVLTQMDRASENFRWAQADFVWDQYQAVVEETDTQTGVIYFRRHGKETDMAADVKKPEAKYVVFSDGKLRLYQRRIDQVTEYDVAKKRGEVESFLVLGFGGGGHDLLRSFEVKLLKREMVDGVNTAVLELTPTSARVRNMFKRMVLWIDPVRGISLKQQFFEPSGEKTSGDYRLAHYTNFDLKRKIPDEVFKLKTNASTKTVTPQM